MHSNLPTRRIKLFARISPVLSCRWRVESFFLSTISTRPIQFFSTKYIALKLLHLCPFPFRTSNSLSRKVYQSGANALYLQHYLNPGQKYQQQPDSQTLNDLVVSAEQSTPSKPVVRDSRTAPVKLKRHPYLLNTKKSRHTFPLNRLRSI